MQSKNETQYNPLMREKLLKVFSGESNVKECVQQMMLERANYTKSFTHEFVKQFAKNYQNSYGVKIDLATMTQDQMQKFAETDPLAFLILTIVYEQDKPELDSTKLREIAFEHAKNNFNDSQLGKHFFYSKSLVPVLSYLFIASGLWQPFGASDLQSAINDQMAGIYKGTIAFEKGEEVSPQMLTALTDKIDLSKIENGKAKEWMCTKVLDDGNETRLDRFYISSRRKYQKAIKEKYEANLLQTSNAIAPILRGMGKTALIIIGAYGAGKTTLLKEYGINESQSNLVSFSVDTMKNFLAGEGSPGSDFHFEGVLMKETIDGSKLEYLFATGAYIDSRFRQVAGNYWPRKIMMVEVATPTIEDTIVRYCEREGEENMDKAFSTANAAQMSRGSRIKDVMENNRLGHVDYKLVCNGKNGFVDVLAISKDEKGARVKTVHDESLLNKLTLEYAVTKDEMETHLNRTKRICTV